MVNFPVRILGSIVGLCFFIVLGGCAGVSRVPLSNDVRNQIPGVEGKISIPADELIVRAQPSNISAAVGGGLIPALIDASVSRSRQSELESATIPFYEQAGSVDFREVFSTQFSSEFGDGQTPFKAIKLHVSPVGISVSDIDGKRDQLSPGAGYFGLRVFYELTPDHRSLIVLANPLLVVGGGTEFAYANSLIYKSRPVSGENALLAWARNGGKHLSDAYRESASEIARMLKHDLSSPSNEVLAANRSDKAKAAIQIPFYGPFFRSPNGALVPFATDGYVEVISGGRKILRSEGGALYSVD